MFKIGDHVRLDDGGIARVIYATDATFTVDAEDDEPLVYPQNTDQVRLVADDFPANRIRVPLPPDQASYLPGDHVITTVHNEPGTVTEVNGDIVSVMFDDDRVVDYHIDAGMLVSAAAYLKSHIRVPLPPDQASYAPTDLVHAAMLRHARNAGAALSALQIISREAAHALGALDAAGVKRQETALQFIHGFSEDVLRHTYSTE